MKTEKRKPGRPTGKNFTVLKQLKINEEQNKNWDRNTPKLIRDLLEGNVIDTLILKKLLVKFIDLEVVLEDTTEMEDKRIMELIKECQLI